MVEEPQGAEVLEPFNQALECDLFPAEHMELSTVDGVRDGREAPHTQGLCRLGVVCRRRIYAGKHHVQVRVRLLHPRSKIDEHRLNLAAAITVLAQQGLLLQKSAHLCVGCGLAI
eukprot:JZ548544.1.p3 GENE.JZ548544.1~~JZ548544.1.p3  ORF type:complete len:115 (-),score=1.59 JZ548544.1:310-654(-)